MTSLSKPNPAGNADPYSIAFWAEPPTTYDEALALAREIDLLASLKINAKGLAEASLPNLIDALSAQIRWRISFDRDRIMIASAGTDAWRPILDKDMVAMRAYLQHALRFAPIGKGIFRDALVLVATRNTKVSA